MTHNLSLSRFRYPLTIEELLAATTDMRTSLGKVSPRSNLASSTSSDGDNLYLKVEVPGVEPSDVKVKIEGKSVQVDTPKGFLYVVMGQRLKSDEATASLKHGILTVKIPTRTSSVIEIPVTEG